jgi:hypothetical protein
MKKIFLLIILTSVLAACAPAAVPPTLTQRPTVQGFRDFPSSMEGHGIALVPGFYKFPAWFQAPLAVEIKESGWEVNTLERAELLALVQGENELSYPDKWLIFLPVYEAEADALLDDLAASPRLTLIAGPEQRTFGANTASLTVFDALPNPDYAGTDEFVPGVQPLPEIQDYAGNWTWMTSNPEARIEYAVLTIGEHTIAVYIEAPQDEFEDFAAQAAAILAEVKPR